MDDCQKVFENLKNMFMCAPVLTHFLPDAQIIIKTDASDYAIVAILSIICLDSEICPIMFLSHMLHHMELNYDTHDKELLAIFEAFHNWRHYLKGSTFPVDVVTDHKNLKYFTTMKILM